MKNHRSLSHRKGGNSPGFPAFFSGISTYTVHHKAPNTPIYYTKITLFAPELSTFFPFYRDFNSLSNKQGVSGRSTSHFAGHKTLFLVRKSVFSHFSDDPVPTAIPAGLKTIGACTESYRPRIDTKPNGQPTHLLITAIVSHQGTDLPRHHSP